MSSRRVALIVLLVLAGTACRRTPEPPAVRAKFGVFFGGQVEEREEIPLVLDRTRQSIGVRLEFETPPVAPARISWELEKPSAIDKGGKSMGTLVDYGDARTRAGEPVLDVPLGFRPGDRPGPWRIRVALDGKNLLDRPFKVIPANEAGNAP